MFSSFQQKKWIDACARIAVASLRVAERKYCRTCAFDQLHQTCPKRAVLLAPIPYPRRQLTLEHGFSSLTLSLSLTVLHYLF